jgi:predicted outer membrane protein
MNARLLAASVAAIIASGVMSAPAFSQSLLNPLAPIVGPVVVAQSPLTQRFVANAMPTVNFLNDSSRMALDKSTSPRIRSFADREAREQTITGNSMIAWADVNAPVVTGRSAYAGPLAPIVGLATVPLDIAGNVVGGTTNFLTNGTIAVAPAARGGLVLPSQQADLTRLSTRSGRDFDTLYISTQIDGLQQLATLYRDYSVNGDDAGLRSLANRELPRVNARLRTLRAL